MFCNLSVPQYMKHELQVPGGLNPNCKTYITIVPRGLCILHKINFIYKVTKLKINKKLTLSVNLAMTKEA